MSLPLYGVGGLRFWGEAELERRDIAVTMLHRAIREALLSLNRAWTFDRVEGPTLTPREYVAPGYDADDLWLLQAQMKGDQVTLRPETTPSTYAYARHVIGNSTKLLPACFWQVGKSYRRETNDGASASRLRFNEFTQAEWQCIYRADSKAPYREAVEAGVANTIQKLCGETRIVPSDRLPDYSQQTNDVESRHNGQWREVCSISTRTDYAPDLLVLEVAVGLDRVVEIKS